MTFFPFPRTLAAPVVGPNTPQAMFGAWRSPTSTRNADTKGGPSSGTPRTRRTVPTGALLAALRPRQVGVSPTSPFGTTHGLSGSAPSETRGALHTKGPVPRS